MADALGMAFIPYYKTLMDVLETNAELKKSAKGIFKQMAWSAGGAALGGFVAGPVGAMVGGVAGALVGYSMADEYDAMIRVLQELSEDEKRELTERVQGLVGSSSIEALVRFVGSQLQREQLLHLLRDAAKEFSKGG